MPELRSVRVAAIQATPVILDAEATIAKTVELLEQAAAQGVELAVLPETFVPVYPSNRWAKGAADFGGWDEFWERLHANSVDVPGPLVDELVAACERLNLHAVIGINERDGGSLYNSYRGARAGRAPAQAPQADADAAGAAVPRHRRRTTTLRRSTRRSAASAA